jgi:hypothetical protein
VFKIPISNPKPDFNNFVKILSGKEEVKKVPII